MSVQSRHQLREQVRTELKRRRYIIYTLLLLSLIYVGINFVFNDTGILRYLELKDNNIAIEADLNRVLEGNERLKTAIDSHKMNDYYIEKHAREEFGLAGPDDYIFIYEKKDNSAP
jgi:cell division protein FtsB